MQVTDKIRSYELNFQPLHHGVTVSCKRYTVGFAIWYGSPRDVFAASSGFVRIYRVSQEECARLREGVPYVKVYRYNPKHLYPKLNGYGDNDQRSLKL